VPVVRDVPKQQFDTFRTRWAAHDVRFHRTGIKKLHDPVVGDLDSNFESMELPSDRSLIVLVYAASADRSTVDAFEVLGSWAATQDQLDTERDPSPARRPPTSS
jgi:hypothetical protein